MRRSKKEALAGEAPRFEKGKGSGAKEDPSPASYCFHYRNIPSEMSKANLLAVEGRRAGRGVVLSVREETWESQREESNLRPARQ